MKNCDNLLLSAGSNEDCVLFRKAKEIFRKIKEDEGHPSGYLRKKAIRMRCSQFFHLDRYECEVLCSELIAVGFLARSGAKGFRILKKEGKEVNHAHA